MLPQYRAVRLLPSYVPNADSAVQLGSEKRQRASPFFGFAHPPPYMEARAEH